MGILCFIYGKATAPQAQGLHIYIAMPTIGLGAGARAHMWLDLVCSWLMPSQITIEVSIEVAILIACIMDHVHINVGEVITDQFKRRAKQQVKALPFPSPFHLAVVPTPTPLDFLKLAQRAKVHESQLVKLAKAIPSMIQIAINKAMQPAKDKLKSLWTTVEVLESKVISLRREVAAIG
ncbi:hypothetical protein HAX54_025607 [Datura stramonium]|uniref:Uncharacterized protein n=1 Tax=Datura stramonium TaxID=4076 RepID=A0ABS8UZT1_DATST|nr:hypothetical protein [Datura stramonium]